MNLNGYLLEECLVHDDASSIYRGIRLEDRQRVIIKTTARPQPSRAELMRYRNELAVAEHLADCGAIARPIELRYQNDRVFLVFEDTGGRALSDLLAHPMDIRRALRMGAAVADALASIHSRAVIHKDIKPANILIDAFEQNAWIIDFDIATRLPSEHREVESPAAIEGTWAYMSPEQTGRMNRGIDYRTDLYSLGITLYQMLTGELPFHASDALGWCHAHMTRTAMAPHILRPELPPMLSALVLKLMAKVAEERYQSAEGLAYDLRRCEQMLYETGTIDTFPLGEADFARGFHIPEKLYGREREIQELLGCFAAVAADGLCRVVAIGGYSGIGKSSLVHELHKPIVATRGHFISGKFDQYKRDIPCYPLIQAVRGLIRQIFGESEDSIEAWRYRLRQALGNNSRVMSELIPELELLLGPQPAVPVLGPSESQNRFNLVFRNFTRALASAESPLAIFLDDMQWADAVTIDLLELLLTDDSLRHICVLLTYRDNEVDPAHPFMLALHRLGRAGATVHWLSLAPLDAPSLAALVGDALRTDTAHPEVLALARIIGDKTGGNPFFVIQFLKRLYRDGLLALEPSSGRLRWNPEEVARRGYTDNVVAHMIEHLRILPAETQEALMLASCIGTTFDLDELRAIDDLPRSQVARMLWPAVSANLIVPIGNDYELAMYMDEPGAEAVRVQYRFLHDRIQQAAYSLLLDERRVATHLQIGRTWRRRADASTLEERVFDIVGQLNHGLALIVDADERLDLAELNLRAGDKARAATAYAAALHHLQLAIQLLPDDAWERHYELAYAVSVKLAECHHLCGNLELAEEMFVRCIDRAKNELARGAVYALRINLAQHSGKYGHGVNLALEALERLGVPVPRDPDSLRSALESLLAEVTALQQARTAEELINATRIETAMSRAIMYLIAEAGSSAYASGSPYFPWIVLMGVKHIMLHGNVETTGVIYGAYAVVMLALGLAARAAEEMSRIGIAISERFDHKLSLGRQLLLQGGFIEPWTQPVSRSAEILERSFAYCRDTGDLLWAGFSASLMFWTLFEYVAPLTELVAQLRPYEAFARQTRNTASWLAIILELQFCATLQGQTRSLASMDDERFSEQDCLQRLESTGYGLGVAGVYVLRQMLLYLAGQYAEAVTVSNQGKAYLPVIVGQWGEANYHMYRGLILCAAHPRASLDEQVSYRQELEEIRHRIARWAEGCSANHGDRLLLIEAEIARLDGNRDMAMTRYEQAAQSARSRGCFHRAGLAFERAGRYFMDLGLTVAGMSYLREAIVCYDAWGADALVSRLEREYSQLGAAAMPVSLPSVRSTSSPATASLDAITVLKATQAISGQLKLKSLIEQLLALAMENAGADHAYLVLMDEGQPVTLFDASGQSLPYTPAAHMPHSAIGFVLRTRESLLLTHAYRHGTYGNDPYIAANHVHSLLCLPIVHQGQLRAVLSLENRLLPDAFAPGRLALLGLIASQAAISIDNAALYSRLEEYSHTLEHRVAERTAELARAKAAAESARAAAEAANQAKSRFLAYVSHEIRTPMNAILGTATLLMKSKLTTEQMHLTGVIRHSGDALLILINDLLDIARIEAGKMQLDVQPFALHACLRDTMELMASTAAAKNIELRAVVDPTIPRVVIGDAARLRQVLLNLLSNALKFTDRGAVTVEVAYEGSLDAELGLHIAVRDTGIGIAREQLDTLFDIFTQLHVDRAHGGSGLGLAICKQLVELMGGRIWVDSEVGKGSTFHVTVALRRAHESKLHRYIESTATIPEPSAAEARALRILVAEDNEINQKITRALLVHAGYETVDVVADGEQAVEAVARSHYDVVLMDVQMPGMGGLEATRRIRAQAQQAMQPRIIALTASTMPDEVDACLKAGMNDYLSKPLTLDALSAALERVDCACSPQQPDSE